MADQAKLEIRTVVQILPLPCVQMAGFTVRKTTASELTADLLVRMRAGAPWIAAPTLSYCWMTTIKSKPVVLLHSPTRTKPMRNAPQTAALKKYLATPRTSTP